MLILKDQLALKLVASREACTWLPQIIQNPYKIDMLNNTTLINFLQVTEHSKYRHNK